MFFLAILGIHIPSIKDLLKDVSLAPLVAFNKLLHSYYLGAVNSFEENVARPVAVQTGRWSDYLWGANLGLAQYLSLGVFAVGLIYIALVPNAARRAPRLGMVMLFVVLAPEYYWLLDQAKVLGQALREGALAVYQSSTKLANQPLLLVPIVSNPIGALLAMGFTLGLGGLTMIVFSGYPALMLICGYILPPFLVISALFDWAVTVTNALVSVILLTGVLGVAGDLFIVKGFQAAADHTVGLNSTVGLPSMINLGLFIGLFIVQPLLFWACWKMVSPITGNIYSRGSSKVTGKVDAKTTEQRKQSEERRRQNYGQTFLPRRGSSSQPVQPATTFASVKQTTRVGGAMLAKHYPATMLVSSTVNHTRKSKQSSRVEQNRSVIDSRSSGARTTTPSRTDNSTSRNGKSRNGSRRD